MIGHDIIYNHPMNHCACLGRVAERDFLTYAHSVSQLDGGVYISIGSAVMSPMIFEKSLSMAQNLAIQRGAAHRQPLPAGQRPGRIILGLDAWGAARGQSVLLLAVQQVVQPHGRHDALSAGR